MKRRYLNEIPTIQQTIFSRKINFRSLREEGTGEAYFFIFQGIFFLFKCIQICTKTSSKPPLLVQY